MWREIITNFEFTAHAERMLTERRIVLEWVNRAVAEPARTEAKEDGTVHYLKPIPEHGGRVLRVVLSPESGPPRVITVFFDRRERREQ